MRRRYMSMTYVYARSDGNLELRYPIPPELQCFFPKTNGLGFRQFIGGSLGTKDTTVANAAAARRISEYEQLLGFLRGNHTDDRITELLRSVYKDELKRDLEQRLEVVDAGKSFLLRAESMAAYGAALRSDDPESLEASAGWLADLIQERLDKTLDVGRDNPIRLRLLHMAQEVLLDAVNAKIARARGLDAPLPVSPALNVQSSVEPGANVALSPDGRKSVSAYLDVFMERWQRAEPRERTVERRRDAWAEFCEVVGPNTPIYRVTKADLWRYHECLLIYPTRANSRRELSGLPFMRQVELARANPNKWPPLDPNTVGDRLRHVGAVFRDAVKRGDLSSNPADGVSEGRALTKVARPAYTVEEFNAILSLPVFKPAPALDQRGDDFWVPLLELFTGARPSELYLPMTDVREDDDIPHFLLEPFEERKLKTPASARWVPVHSDLIKAGFLEYCRTMRASGQRLLFPEWDFEAGLKPSEAPKRRRFNRMLAQAVDPGRRFKDSYTFRSTFETAISSSPNISERVARKLTGRALGGSARHYVDRLELAALRDAIEEVTYKGVDRSHIYFLR